MSNAEARTNDPDLRLLKMCQELTEKVNVLEQERQSLSNQNVQLAFKVGDVEKQRAAAVAALEALRSESGTAAEELRAAQALAEEAGASLRAELAAARAEVEPLRAELTAVQAQAEQAGTDLAAARAQAEEGLGALRAEVTAAQAQAQQANDRARGIEAAAQQALVEKTRQFEQQLAAGAARVGELEGELARREEQGGALRQRLAERETELAELQATLESFKEQFLAKAQTSLEARPAAAETPGEVLRFLAQDALGSTGRILVDSIFTRLEYDPATTEPAHLREVVNQLLDYAEPLASPEQYAQLQGSLERFRGYDNPSDSSEMLPAVEVEEEEEDLVFEVPVPAPVVVEEPSAPEVPEPVVEVAEPEVVPAVEAPGGVPAPPPEPVSEELVRLEDEEVAGDLPALTRATDADVRARIDEGMRLLEEGKFEQSLELFVALHQEHPHCLEVQIGMFYNYVGFDCYMEAYEFGERLLPVMLDGEGRERFVTAMASVLKMRLEQTRNLAEKKAWLLQLAELHLDQPQVALKYLRQAQRMPDEIPGDGRIAFYLTKLLADTREDRMPYLHTYMSRVAESRDVFRHIQDIYGVPKYRQQHPAMDLVLTLGNGTRAQAQAMQEQRATLEPGLLDAASTPAERALLELVLDKLAPGTANFPAPRVTERLKSSDEAGDDWRPAALAQELRQALFGNRQGVTVYRYSGSDEFLTDISPEKTWVLLLHRRADELPEEDLRFYILRRYYQAARRHLHLYRLHECLTDEGRRDLLRKVLQGGPDITNALQRETDKLLDQTQEITLGQWRSVLDRLYSHARHEDFRLLFRLFTEDFPFAERLSAAADQFAARAVGLATASYALTRELAPQWLSLAEQAGLQSLYQAPLSRHRELRLRLQRLWLAALKPA